MVAFPKRFTYRLEQGEHVEWYEAELARAGQLAEPLGGGQRAPVRPQHVDGGVDECLARVAERRRQRPVDSCQRDAAVTGGDRRRTTGDLRYTDLL